jgi:hypothetical protein
VTTKKKKKPRAPQGLTPDAPGVARLGKKAGAKDAKAGKAAPMKRPKGSRRVLVLFALTMFTSAGLLFSVEPLLGKLVLPLFGGTPGVWATCTLFFQVMLLGGYLYAHLGARLPLRTQLVAHCIVLALVVAALPFHVREHFIPKGDDNPTVSLLLLLVTLAAAPFFMVSATAPLLQRWLAQTDHPEGDDPYFLYGASNLGSMLALVAYPLLVEPKLRLSMQSDYWRWGYVGLVALSLLCARVVWQLRRKEPRQEETVPESEEAPPEHVWREHVWRERARWAALAFVPSSLMLGMTTYATSDVAPIPLLWVVPLFLYLASFVIAYSKRGRRGLPWVIRALPFVALLSMFFVLTRAPANMWLVFGVHMVTLLIVSVAFHGQVARERPKTSRLTEYYLVLSIGGGLGGIFNAILAPMMFDRVIEVHLTMALAFALLPRPRVFTRKGEDPDEKSPLSARRVAVIIAAASVAFALALFSGAVRGLVDAPAAFVDRHWHAQERDPIGHDVVLVLVLFLVPLAFARRPIRLRAALAGVVFGASVGIARDPSIVLRERSFFGVMYVKKADDYYELLHGSTLHGRQSRKPELREVPMAYYFPTTPIGRVFQAYDERSVKPNVGVVGLGVGNIAAYAYQGQTFTFYEIDPAVVHVARDSGYFTFLKDASARGADIRVEVGDARLKLKEARDAAFDLLIIDAFNSDAVPVHLLTREAFKMYVSKIKPEGIIAFHVSNRYLTLPPVVANQALKSSMYALLLEDEGKFPAVWVCVSTSFKDLQAIPHKDDASEFLIYARQVGIWTDDFSNVLSIFDWNASEE